MKKYLGLVYCAVLANGFAALELPDEPRAKPTPTAAKSAPVVEPANEVTVVFDLQDGSRVVGRMAPRNLPVTIRSESIGDVKIPLERIRGVQFAASNQPVVVTLVNGDKLQGTLLQEAFKITTTFGKISIATPLAKKLAVTAAGSARVPEGCVLWYSFDADEGDRVTDKSGREHHARVQGARFAGGGKVGGAYQFTGGAKQMWAPNDPDWAFGDRPFSIALWVNLNVLPDQQRSEVMVAHDEAAGDSRKWVFEFFRDGICFHINGPQMGSGHRIARHRFQPELNRWYHLAITRERSSYRLYVDGSLVKTDENTVTIPVAAAELTIGQAEGLGINGLLDEVMIFNRGLSAAEIQDFYDSKK